MKNHKHQPVGVFDSGIGGLTVANAISRLLPNEQIIYFGDTAHLNVPGGKHFMEVLSDKIGTDDRVAATIQNLPQTRQ